MPQYQLQDLDLRVLDRLEGNSLFYVQSERYNAINEALRVLNIFTGFTQGVVSVPGGTQAGRYIYDRRRVYSSRWPWLSTTGSCGDRRFAR